MVNVKTALFLLPLATYVSARPIDTDLTAQDVKDSTAYDTENLAAYDDEDLAARGIETLVARDGEDFVSQDRDDMARSYSSDSVSDDTLVIRDERAGIVNLAIERRGILGEIGDVIKDGAKSGGKAIEGGAKKTKAKLDPKNKPESKWQDPRKKPEAGYTGSSATDPYGRSHPGAKLTPGHSNPFAGPSSRPDTLPHERTPAQYSSDARLMGGQSPGRHPSPFSDINREPVPKGRKTDSSHDATGSKSSRSNPSSSG